MVRLPTAPIALLALLAVCILVATAGVAAPPPVDVCGVCGLADDTGYPPDQPDATILDSSLTVTIAENGTTRWVEQATVDEETATQLREDASYRERVIESTRIVTQPRNLTVTLDGQQLTVSYGGQQPAARQLGVTVFDFDQSSYQPSIGAYEVVVRGPSETVAQRVPGNGERQNGAAVWPAGVTDGFGRTTVVFASSGLIGSVLAHVVGLRLRILVGVLLVVAAVAVGRRLAPR